MGGRWTAARAVRSWRPSRAPLQRRTLRAGGRSVKTGGSAARGAAAAPRRLPGAAARCRRRRGRGDILGPAGPAGRPAAHRRAGGAPHGGPARRRPPATASARRRRPRTCSTHLWFRDAARFAAGALGSCWGASTGWPSWWPRRRWWPIPFWREELIPALPARARSAARRRDRLAVAEASVGTTLDTVERKRVIREAEAAERRAQEVREAMSRKAAEESAAAYDSRG